MMPVNDRYLPEGLRAAVPLTPEAIRMAADSGTILEGRVLRCDARRDLHVRVGPFQGLIPREEAIAPWISGAQRDIALLSRVGRFAAFKITAFEETGTSGPRLLLSRRAAQEEAAAFFLETLRPGTVLTCRVTHLEPFGAFLDIGCGIVAMLPIEYISVSRIPHPGERFTVGQKLLAAVRSVDRDIPRFTMTHQELLGTWEENAALFRPGDTVPGTVRSVRPYGSFVELTPNLSGLADNRPDLREGDRVSVYIRSIRPEAMKLKLQVIDRLNPAEAVPAPLRYLVPEEPLSRWLYSPPGCQHRIIGTDFTEACP